MAVLSFVVAGLGLATPGAHAARGDLDPSFAGDGTVEIPSITVPAAIGTASDRRSVVVGFDEVADHQMVVAVRLLADGTIDQQFGDAGTASVDVRDFGPGPTAVAVDSSQRTLVVGSNRTGASVARLTPQGQLDSSFGNDGVVDIASLRFGRDVAFDASGRILIGADGESDYIFSVARLLEDGSLDPAFGDQGITTTATGNISSTLIGGGGALTVTADQRILAGGGPAVTRLDPAGDPDAGFGQGGVADLSANPTSGIDGIVSLPNGQIVVGWRSCRVIGPGSGCSPTLTLLDGQGVQIDAEASEVGTELTAAEGSSFLALGSSDDYGLPQTLQVSELSDSLLPVRAFGERGSASRYVGLRPAEGVDIGPVSNGTVTALADLRDGPAAVARLLLGPGTPDADADGVADADDRCPLGNAPGSTGCPTVRRKVRLRATRHGLIARIDASTSACQFGTEVVLRRRGKHRAVRVDSDTADGAGRVRFHKIDPGRYLAVVRANDTPIAHCRGATGSARTGD